jgi:hypothetical protein
MNPRWRAAGCVAGRVACRGEYVVKSIVRIGLLALLASVAGCASVQVHSVGTNTGQAAYDLSGPDLDTLTAEARRLCPQGHEVMRQWQRSNHSVGDANDAANWALRTAALSYDLQPEQAQMSIACKA